MCQQVLHKSQDIERGVGEIFKPLTTPVHCRILKGGGGGGNIERGFGWGNIERGLGKY